MRNVFIGFLFLVAIWIGWGAPVPGVRLSQMQPDPSLPTFQPVTKGDDSFERAPQNDRVVEDPTIRRLNERVVNAAHRLEAFPCDAAARRELRAAVAAYFKEHIRRVRSGEADKAERNNVRRVRTSPLTDDDIDMIINDGVYQGVLQPEDIGGRRAAKGPFVPMGGLDTTGRFVCENDFKR
jgi:hypothetical protein